MDLVVRDFKLFSRGVLGLMGKSLRLHLLLLLLPSPSTWLFGAWEMEYEIKRMRSERNRG